MKPLMVDASKIQLDDAAKGFCFRGIAVDDVQHDDSSSFIRSLQKATFGMASGNVHSLPHLDRRHKHKHQMDRVAEGCLLHDKEWQDAMGAHRSPMRQSGVACRLSLPA